MSDLFAYRGWPWWCGTAWLILGCIGFVTNARFLIAPAFLLLGVGVAGLAMEGLRTGTVEVQFGTYSRLRNPINFWFFVLFYMTFGSMVIVAALVGLLRRTLQ
jgi:hypothetical protein